MRYPVLVMLLAAMCFAQDTAKPVCNAQNQGQLWPAQANFDSNERRQLYQRGELEMCSLAMWKYRWERLSVNVHDLAKKKHSLLAKFMHLREDSAGERLIKLP